ncbi:beta-N-acetylhexosaminidase [Paludibacterium paludis]|uniref:Beta-hexosaminidase n=1 Tax=Paludibacterium paludis TaxID=1225769 RepID=A0A918U793_9NEIS|nr:beta-N-acetylhexosaminidase [Paludibacterium paludis]GGY06322.1 beta-hexosaminidase [Paludibacterium paludis]
MTDTLSLPRGPVMVDVAGLVLTEEERRRLSHPLVGGVILFRRNFASVAQLEALTREIHAIRSPALLIAADHEGGRVQRFLDGFTRLPPMAQLGRMWHSDREAAIAEAKNTGYVLAAELRAAGVDLSFTPVLDLDHGRCAVIGNRAFDADPAVVAELASALLEGLAEGGMGSCGKHFPGHGWVEGDSHHVIPSDERAFDDLMAQDIVPFSKLVAAGLTSVMPAHVVYPSVDPLPAGFSAFWLKTVLRGRLGFDGVIFSDDLCMEGAAGAGDIVDRARAAFSAGCDMVLVCNRPDLADQLLARLDADIAPELAGRLERMAGKDTAEVWRARIRDAAFDAARERVRRLGMPDGALAGPAVGEAV